MKMTRSAFRTCFAVVLLLAGLSCSVRAQVRLSLETGVTYLSNDAGQGSEYLADFFALTINPRLIVAQGDYSALAIESPFSIRHKLSGDVNTRFGIHLPLLVTYSIGSGSGGDPDNTLRSKIGATAGLGWGYFFQRARSAKGATEAFDQSLQSSGPEIQLGIRVPLKKQLILFDRAKPASLVLAVKSNYLINLENDKRNIGSFAVLFGFRF